MLAFVLFGLFFLMVFLNVPVAVALGLSSTIGLWIGGFSLTTIADAIYSAIGKFTLLAIPFFILAGVIMEYAGISRRLVRFARVCVGHTKSGLVAVVVLVSCFLQQYQDQDRRRSQHWAPFLYLLWLKRDIMWECQRH